MDDPRYDPRMLAKYGVDPEQDKRHRELLMKELTKVRQDAREKTEFDNLPLKELRDNYRRLYAEACIDMEKITGSHLPGGPQLHKGPSYP
ncbi:hypothetical protein HW555_002360 [Spodoptera exigua]|uniref:Uncharacterized protein n=1 Tax=Spodoptera exigua TaxID=7107 RepID=A0A835GS50_SPOEX|nr:hypothetical protein HW555_002360 [Spodoptera exigua]